MKFCYECGYKLEGFEKFCPECGKEFKNPEDTEDLIGSIVNQTISDIEELKEDAIGILRNFDIDDIIDDFSKNSKRALNRDAIYINRARKKLGSDDKRALELCNRALIVNEFNWEAYYIKARALINLKRYDEAIEDLISSLALNENHLESRLYIAEAYNLKGDWKYALKVYDSILNIDGKYFEALTGKALIYFEHDDYFEARSYFEKANDVCELNSDMKSKWNFCDKKMKEE